jgi:integrase
MTWEKAKHRWRKMHKGKVYTVSCEALNVAATKESSYQAANAWWKAKRAELDAATKKPHQEQYEQAISQRQEMLRWFRLELERVSQNPEEKLLYERVLDELKQLEHDLALASPPEINVPGTISIYPLAGMPAGALIEWHDRLQSLNEHLKWSGTEPVPADLSVGGQVKAWTARQEARVRSGSVSPGQHVNLARCLLHFRNFDGAELHVEKIDGTKLEAYFLELSTEVKKRREDPQKKAGMSPDYAAKHLAVARSFIRYLWRKELVALPRNIDSKEFGFKKGSKSVPTMTVDEVRNLIDNATGQLKLHLLLMINTGMTQKDIADLKDSEVVWEHGRIIRKRSKTEDHDDVPLVNYKLWPVTADLLRRYRSGTEIVLLTRSGARWAWERLTEDGKYRTSDNIATNYNWLKERLKTKGLEVKPLKLLRKTSATKIESHREYGRYVSHFLGHSPRTIKDRHYSAPSQELFDEIVEWLGAWFGYAGPLTQPES